MFEIKEKLHLARGSNQRSLHNNFIAVLIEPGRTFTQIFKTLPEKHVIWETLLSYDIYFMTNPYDILLFLS